MLFGPLHGLSMDIVSIRVQGEDHTIIVYQDLFTRFVWLDRVEDSSAETCALSYMRTIISKVGASKVLRIDRDRRWLSAFFQALCKQLGQRQRATLAYRPQGNAQNERVHPVIYGALKMFCEEIDMSDWKWKYAYLEFAINTAWNAERIETSFYLLYGWDAMAPMEAMMDRPVERFLMKKDTATNTRREMQRDVQKARKIIQENIELHWLKQIDDYNEQVKGKPFREGERVWLYVNTLPRDIPKKLTHRWHGPFRILKVYNDGIYYKIELSPGYAQVFDKVHFNRLKRCYDAFKRPDSDPDDTSMQPWDFDEALLPEDSFEPDEEEGIFEVEKILDRRDVARTRSGIAKREYLIKWKGYDESYNTWEPESGLSCGGLIYDFDREYERKQRVNSLSSIADEKAEVHWGICGSDSPTIPIETVKSTEKGRVLMDNWMRNNIDLLSGPIIRTNSDRYTLKILKRHIFEICCGEADNSSTAGSAVLPTNTVAPAQLFASAERTADMKSCIHEGLHYNEEYILVKICIENDLI